MNKLTSRLTSYQVARRRIFNVSRGWIGEVTAQRRGRESLALVTQQTQEPIVPHDEISLRQIGSKERGL